MTRHLKQVLLLRTTLLKTLSAEKEKHYCQLLNLWLRKRCTREEFDFNVAKFLSNTGLKLHNKFLGSLSKISCGLMALPLDSKQKDLRKLENINCILFYKFVDKTLPCATVCSARFLVSAWTAGIVSVNPQVGKFLHVALNNFLRELIFTLVSIKRSSKRTAHNFKYLATKEEQKIPEVKLPSGFIKSSISSNHLILALQQNPGIIKMGLSKYVEFAVDGILMDNVAKIMPLTM